MATITNPHGKRIDFDAAHNIMDDDICNELSSEVAPCSEQDFFDAYIQRHAAKFGEQFEPAKQNPVW